VVQLPRFLANIQKSMTAKKILLISANAYQVPYPVYPLGISCLASYLSKHRPDWDIKLYDVIVDGPDGLEQLLIDFKPDYTGISLRNIDDVNFYQQQSFLGGYKRIIEKVRKNSESKVVIGGAGFSIFPELLFDLLKPDFAVYGEGEKSFLQLIECLEKNQDYSAIEGLIYSSGGKQIKNKKSDCLQNLSISLNNHLTDFYWKNSGMLSLQTKRGCPYSCIYCTYPLIEGKQVRTFSIDEVVDIMHDLYFNKKIEYIFFTDSVFNINYDYNYELAEKLIRKKIGIKWGGFFNFLNLDKKLLSVMKKSGLTHIEFGTDSLSDRTLEAYDKNFRVKDILTISSLCNELDIHYAHFLILCGYGETMDTLKETFENSKKFGRTVFFPFIGMRIYPDTPLYNHALREGQVDANDKLEIPKYYISKNVNVSALKTMAKETGRSWIFPDDDKSDAMVRLRNKNKKGPLWEYLIS
jgi:radical SAM superfamily enzyme YgiQ (UPF0313 family)